MGNRRRDDRMSRSVSLLISMLVRYPEVGTVKYEPQQQTIRMNLLINGELPAEEFARLEQAVTESLEVYHLLQQLPPATVEVAQESYGGLTSVSITRDARTLSPEEVYIIIELFRERFAGRLVAEAIDYPGEEEMLAQDEMIEEILADLEESRSTRNLIAIREDGRVMVFQK